MSLAQSLAREYPDGGSFYLEGDLGAGKTVFAKGIATAYGIDPNRVVSPTFALVNRYSGGAKTIFHIDLYRIENEQELVELGLDEMEEEEAAVLVVEWPEKLGRYRRPEAVIVRLQTIDDNSREIQIHRAPPRPE